MAVNFVVAGLAVVGAFETAQAVAQPRCVPVLTGRSVVLSTLCEQGCMFSNTVYSYQQRGRFACGGGEKKVIADQKCGKAS